MKKQYLVLAIALLASAGCARMYRNGFHEQLTSATPIANPVTSGRIEPALHLAPIGNWGTAEFRLTSLSRDEICFSEQDPSAIGDRHAELHVLPSADDTDRTVAAHAAAKVQLVSTGQVPAAGPDLQFVTMYRYRICFPDPTYITKDSAYLVVNLMLGGGGLAGPTEIKAFWKLVPMVSHGMATSKTDGTAIIHTGP